MHCALNQEHQHSSLLSLQIAEKLTFAAVDLSCPLQSTHHMCVITFKKPPLGSGGNLIRLVSLAFPPLSLLVSHAPVADVLSIFCKHNQALPSLQSDD